MLQYGQKLQSNHGKQNTKGQNMKETTLKERLEDLLKKQGLSHNDLLVRIGRILYPNENPYDFAKREKSNFSNMLSGNRKFNREYIAPIERILNTTWDYLLNGGGYPIPKELRNKGLEYAAYTNKYEEFKRLSEETDVDDGEIILNYDEYSKNIMDYIIEYRADEGIRFLYETKNLKYSKYSYFTEYAQVDEAIEIVKILVEKNKLELLYNVLNPYQLIEERYHDNSLFKQDEFKELVLDNQALLEKFMDNKIVKFDEHDFLHYKEGLYINPILQILLDKALQQPQKYEKQITIILDYGIKHNKELQEFLIKHISNKLRNIKIEEKGYVSMVVEFYAKYYGSTLLFDKNIEIFTGEIRKRLELLLKSRQLIYDLLKTVTIEGDKTPDKKYVWRKSSNNPVEYEMLRICEEKGFDKVPKYYETKDGRDRLDNIVGIVKQDYYYDFDKIKEIIEWLKEFHQIAKEHLGTKVYVHKDIVENSVFNYGGSIEAIVGWENCEIGEDYEDVADVISKFLVESRKVFNYHYNKETFKNVKQLLQIYEADKDFKEKLFDRVDSILAKELSYLDKTSQKDENSYVTIRNLQIFMEIYGERLRKE